MCSWRPDLNLESWTGAFKAEKLSVCWYHIHNLEEVDEDVGGGVDDEEEVADCGEQGSPDRIRQGGGGTMSL